MKSIDTLIRDIYETVKEERWFGPELFGPFSAQLSRSLNQEARVPGLRLSQMGPKCPRALWYSVHSPELAEPLPPWARIKYAYGHILEAYVIAMAKAAGHEVLGEQDELIVDGVHGHRDCVIDGCVVDVKSSSTRGFQKFKDGSIGTVDDFGYLDQLDGYLVGSQHDPLVRNKRSGYLLAIDKTLGHLVLYEHTVREDSIRSKIEAAKRIIGGSRPPPCQCGTTPDGKSGNVRLDVKASYSPYKHACHPHLRTFLYSDGPRYLTHVARLPEVPELNKHGKIIQ